jgi:hypothetical protein
MMEVELMSEATDRLGGLSHKPWRVDDLILEAGGVGGAS